MYAFSRCPSNWGKLTPLPGICLGPGLLRQLRPTFRARGQVGAFRSLKAVPELAGSLVSARRWVPPSGVKVRWRRAWAIFSLPVGIPGRLRQPSSQTGRMGFPHISALHETLRSPRNPRGSPFTFTYNTSHSGRIPQPVYYYFRGLTPHRSKPCLSPVGIFPEHVDCYLPGFRPIKPMILHQPLYG